MADIVAENWRDFSMMPSIRAVLAAAVLIVCPGIALALTDADRAAAILKSIDAYQACGHPCACPYSVDSRGAACGRRSAYIRPGGRHPLCYPSDVPGPEVPAIEPPDRCARVGS